MMYLRKITINQAIYPRTKSCLQAVYRGKRMVYIIVLNCLVSCTLKAITYIWTSVDVLILLIRDVSSETGELSARFKVPLFASVQKSCKMITASRNIPKIKKISLSPHISYKMARKGNLLWVTCRICVFFCGTVITFTKIVKDFT